MSISRGLAALTLIIIFQTTLFAEYLYKDEVVENPKFNEEIERLGNELYEKTGVALRLAMIRDLPDGMTMQTYQESILKSFNEPTVLLTFAELNSQLDIMASDTSLYKYFNRDRVLSPVASMAQAIAMGFLYAKSIDDFFELIDNRGGTILPLLGTKSKDGMTADKYAAAMFNGYLDIAAQIANYKEVELTSVNAQGRNYVLSIVKILFYGVLLMALIMYIRKKLYERRKKNEFD